MSADATTRTRPRARRLTRCGASATVAAVLLAGGCANQTRTVPLDLSTAGSASTPAPLGPVTPGKSSNGRTVLVTVDGDVQRSYRMHIPLTAPSGPRPLVIVLHTGGSRPQTVQYTVGMDNVADRLGLYVVYPEAVGGHWNDGRLDNIKSSGGVNDVDFLVSVLKDMRAREPIDLRRVFVVGHGDGGIMAACFAAAKPKLVTGIGLISSQLGDDTTCSPPKKPVSVLLVHGTADPIFPSEGSFDDGLRSFPATVDYFRALDRLSGSATTKKLADRDPQDGTRVSRAVWGDPKRLEVAVYTVRGGGHPWPGGETSSRTLARLGRTSRDLDTSAVIGHFALDVRARP